MKLVLIEDVTHVGRKGDQVTVANGYGINYLIPNRKALKADSPEGMRFSEAAASVSSVKTAAGEALVANLESLSGQSLTFAVEANESGVLFGGLTEAKLAGMINDSAGVNINAKNLDFDGQAIKEVGEYTVKLVNGSDSFGAITVAVTAK